MFSSSISTLKTLKSARPLYVPVFKSGWPKSDRGQPRGYRSLKRSKNEELIQVEKTRLSRDNHFYRRFYREALDQNNFLDGIFEGPFVFQ